MSQKVLITAAASGIGLEIARAFSAGGAKVFVTKPFASGDWFKGTPEEYGQEATTYIAYCGPFHVDEQKKTLTHSMFVSRFPNWLGQTQPRNVKIEDNTFHLSTVSPIHSGGKIVNSYLQWKRAVKG
jgi:hypothetical protein